MINAKAETAADGGPIPTHVHPASLTKYLFFGGNPQCRTPGSRIIYPARSCLKTKSPEPIVRTMLMQAIAQKLVAAMLAFAVVIATAPVVGAVASPNPCDCPSMHMPDHSMAQHIVPEKQKNAPCNEKQSCMCGVSCGATVSLPQQSFPLPSFVPSNGLAWFVSSGGPGLSIKPAIPPPIPLV